LQTFPSDQAMSALPLEADVGERSAMSATGHERK